jgi:hypothetical protein
MSPRHGRVRLRGVSHARRFSIPAGHTRRVGVHLTDAGYRRLRRKAARPGSATVTIDMRTDDGDRPDVRRELTVFVQHS